uniref:NADH dehydrogenase subunit 2 n=1 Tax=Lacrimia lanifica TaxID=2016125 RepID=A0A6G5ZV28_9EUGL|nr:NADH dehydrogenase subunit 2 [Lacrimia lanifica]
MVMYGAAIVLAVTYSCPARYGGVVVYSLPGTFVVVHTIEGLVASLVVVLAGSVLTYMVVLRSGGSDLTSIVHRCYAWIPASILVDTVLLSALPQGVCGMTPLVWCLVLKGWLHLASLLVVAVYLLLNKVELTVVVMMSYVVLLVLLPTGRFFFFFFFFFSCCVVLVVLLHLLLSTYTWSDVMLLLSCITTCTTLAVLTTGVPSTTWCYLVVCASVVVMYLFGVVSLLDINTPSQLLVSSLHCSVRQKLWCLVLLTNTLGLPTYWYAVSKLEVALTSMLSLHTFFFFFLLLLAVVWVYRVMVLLVSTWTQHHSVSTRGDVLGSTVLFILLI